MSYIAKTAYYGKTSTNYEDDRIGEPIWAMEDIWLSSTLNTLPKGISVLDIPVGTGRFLSLYKQREYHVSGFDISEDMIQLSLSRQFKMGTNYTIMKADAEAIPMPEGSVDLIICFRLFHLVPFPIIKRILREFYRVSSADVIIEVFDSSFRSKPNQAVHRHLLQKIIGFMAKKNLNNDRHLAHTGKPWDSIENFSYSRKELIKQIIKCGFEIKKIDHLDDLQNPASIFYLRK